MRVASGLTNADQRITEDVEKFSFAIAELYSYTFKPLLDVLLFTRSLSKTMGYKGQFGLYAYYVVRWVPAHVTWAGPGKSECPPQPGMCTVTPLIDASWLPGKAAWDAAAPAVWQLTVCTMPARMPPSIPPILALRSPAALNA